MSAFRYFTIVQFVPDPIADERINVGIIVIDEKVHYRFLSKWNRVKSFGRTAHSFTRVQSFHDELEELCLGLRPSIQLTIPEMIPAAKQAPDMVREMVENWSHVIQFTPLRPSRESPQALLDRLAERYLKQTPTKQRVGKSRPQVTSTVTDALRSVIRGDERLYRQIEIEHKFSLPGSALPRIPTDFSANQLLDDVEVSRASGFSVSFQIADEREIESQFKDSILKINDIRQANQARPPVLAIAPPLPNTKDIRVRKYDELMEIAERAKVQVVRLDEAEDWAYSTLTDAGVAAD